MSTTQATQKYIDVLRMSKEQKDDQLIESHVEYAKANAAQHKANLTKSISDTNVKLKREMASTNLDIATVINLRRELKALMEDLSEVKALETELF